MINCSFCFFNVGFCVSLALGGSLHRSLYAIGGEEFGRRRQVDQSDEPRCERWAETGSLFGVEASLRYGGERGRDVGELVP